MTIAGFHTQYQGMGRSELEQRCAAAETDVERLKGMLEIPHELARVARCVGPPIKLANGTGGARAIAMRERIKLEHENARPPTWRQGLALAVAEVLAETEPAKLSPNLVRLAAVVVRWSRSLEEVEP
jgi:hypothetical protein